MSPNAIEEGRPLILISVEGRGDVRTTRVLLAHGADINGMGNVHRTALMEASNGGDVTTVKFLLRHGADPNIANSAGRTALFHLTTGGRNDATALEIARLLVTAGADPCHRDKAGEMAATDRQGAPFGPAGQDIAESCRLGKAAP